MKTHTDGTGTAEDILVAVVYETETSTETSTETDPNEEEPLTLQSSNFSQVGQLIYKNFFNDGNSIWDQIKETAFSADGLTVAIGAPYYGNNNQGAVRVLRWESSAQVWTLHGTNQSDIFEENEHNGHYGWSVSLSSDGNRLAVVQRVSDVSYGKGSAYVY